MKTCFATIFLILGFCSVALPAEDQLSYIPSDQALHFGPPYAGQKIELMLPERHVTSITITDTYFKMSRFPPAEFYLDPLNKILKENVNFSTLTNLPKDSVLYWRGYADTSTNPPIRVDMYSKPDCVVLTCAHGSGIIENSNNSEQKAATNQ